MQVLLGVIHLFLLLLLNACGPSPISMAIIPTETTPVLITREAGSEEVGSQTIVLMEPTLLFSETRPLNPENYWAAWQDPNLGYIAASRVGVPVTVPNYPPNSVGRTTGAEPVPQVFSPSGDPLTPGPSCSVPVIATLEIETVELPPVTRGGPENFVVRARVRDQNGEILLDESGNPARPQILTEAARGSITPATGLTDLEGFFRATAQISSNLPPRLHYMLVATDATYELPDGQVLSASRGPVRMDLIKDGGGGGGGGGGFVGGPARSARADVIGDPHLYTLDRRRYTFQGVGEYILSRSLSFVPESSPFYDPNSVQPLTPFELQARFRPFAGSTVASVARAIALQLGANEISLTLNPEPELTLNGMVVPLAPGQSQDIELEPLPENLCKDFDDDSNVCQDLDLCEEFSDTDISTCISSLYFDANPQLSLVRNPDGSYSFEFLSGFNRTDIGFGNSYEISLRAVPYLTESERFAHLSFSLNLPNEYAAAVGGLLGNFDGDTENDLLSSTGIQVSDEDFEGLYRTFGDSWRVSSDTSLFSYKPGESTESFSDPGFPSAFATFTQERRQAAERVCQRVSPPAGLSIEDCIYDVAVMGTGVAEAYEIVELPPELVLPPVGEPLTGTPPPPPTGEPLPLDRMDPILVAILRQATGIQDGPIFPSDLANIRDLTFSRGVTSLAGLETADFSSLTFLQIGSDVSTNSNPNLTSLEGLPAELPALTSLEIGGPGRFNVDGNNNLTSLEGLPDVLPNLTNLFIRGNRRLTSLEGLPAELPTLTTLGISPSSLLCTAKEGQFPAQFLTNLSCP
ncbi:MAG: hypothetical protein HC924_06700 [Synechococcaceae cyanobacterium SM2_3_2]|nr:hypothetical protein [Synechococcaceae cyanobacterium SM2_3_2]